MNRQAARLISCLALLTVAACSSDISAPTAVDRTGRIVPREPDLTASNAYVCSITQFGDDGAAIRVEKRIRPRSRPSLEQVDSDTAFMASWHVRYDRTSTRKLLEAHCVLPVNQEARRYATRYFDSIDPVTLEGYGGVPIKSDVGLWTGTIWCSYYSYYDEIDCYGTTCTNTYMMSVRGRHQPKPGTGLLLSDTFSCDNGCVIYGGSLTYECPSEGGGPFDGGGDDGGGGGGGSSEPPATAPDGVDQDAYNRLTPAEKTLCHASPNECLGVFNAKTYAEDYVNARAQADGFTGDLADNKYDAMRHAYWNAVMTRAMGAERAEAWATAHESALPADNPSKCMDLHNNAIGRQVGTEMVGQTYPAMQERITNLANTGGLQTSPGC